MAQGTECRPVDQGDASLIPSRAHAWVAGQVHSGGVCERQPHTDVSLPLFFPPFLILTINQSILKKSYYSWDL